MLQRVTLPMTQEIRYMCIAYSYLRCSALRQLRGETRRRQLEWSEQKARQKGARLDDRLRLQDWGRSAFRGRNAAVGNLRAFLDAIESGDIAPGSLLLIESLDRLSRAHVDEAWELFVKILKAGVIIITREPDREYSLAQMRGNFFQLMEPLWIFA